MDRNPRVLEPGADKSFWTVPGLFVASGTDPDRGSLVVSREANLFIQSFQFNIHKSLNKYFGKKSSFLVILLPQGFPLCQKWIFVSSESDFENCLN